MAETRLGSKPPSSDVVRAMITPEGVDLRLNLGEVSQRASALILDLLIMGCGFVVLSIAIVIILVAFHTNGSEPLLIAWLAGIFLLRNFYFIAFELGPRAATPGKRRMGLRVAARNGGQLTADAIFVRNVMRELELFLPMTVLFMPATNIDGWLKALAIMWCAVFVLLPLFNRDRLRAGDLLAGTWVVRVPQRRLLPRFGSGGIARGARHRLHAGTAGRLRHQGIAGAGRRAAPLRPQDS